MRRVSIGINWQGAFDIDEVVEQAKVADEAGVDSLFVAEAWGRDAFTILAVLARETSHIKLGTSIVNIYSRSPGALAQHFATLDELSGGRMIIGLGSSGPQVIEHFHGVPFEKPLTRVKEYVDVINMLMREEPLQYHGKIFKLERGFTLRFTPVRPHIPIYLASITPKSLEQTAAIADGWFPIFIPKPQWKSQLDAFRGYIAAAGRQPDDVIVRNPNGVTVTDNPERAREGTASGAAFYIARMGDFYYQHFLRMGYADEANAVRRAWADGGAAAGAAALPAELVEELGTAGTVEQCIDAMEEAESAGFQMHSVNVAERDPKKRVAIFKQLVG
ncbi:MAG: LLM class flavin-dependent oxidoreductase [Chloroflexi bacterium]|nr:LLM class flavin-dependent oxidoreductase [Chloroflexota bacterium]